ncbi:MAG: S8 family serine peptidase, partial [Limisphaerales bacterium]
DPRFGDLWGLNNIGGQRSLADADIDAPEAWSITTGSPDVLIGVLDTGIDISHSDLAANIWTNPGEIPNDGVDNDGNGYVDDVNGWDFWNGDRTIYDPADGDGHGTFVAGIIGASGNNGLGVVGVNWNAKIMPLKFIGPEVGYFSGAADAVRYAAEKGVKVINGSFGRFSTGPGDVGQGLKDVIQASGILFVAAAGNEKVNTDTTPFFPASYDLDLVISVAATDKQDKLASFSNFGATSVDLGAPGVGIFSTVPNNQINIGAGTSFAAPCVAGVAGLIYARFPGLTPIEVKNRILAGVDPVSALAGKSVTGGRLNAANSLVSWDSPPSVAITGPASGAIVTGIITLSANAVDDAGISSVTFFLDGNTLLDTDTTSPYEINWDSSAIAEGTHSITALATDTANQSASHVVNVFVDNYNDAPTAKAGPDQTIPDADSNGTEIVTLNGSTSFDPDGTIVAYEWKEGATVLGNGAILSAFFSVGAHTITLTVTDDEGATALDTVVVQVNNAVPAEMHAGDLDGTATTQGTKWKGTVVVIIHNATHQVVPGATVTGVWSGGFTGSASATTGANGQCSLVTALISKSNSATFSITALQHPSLAFKVSANHDPDGDSNGTSITVNKP